MSVVALVAAGLWWRAGDSGVPATGEALPGAALRTDPDAVDPPGARRSARAEAAPALPERPDRDGAWAPAGAGPPESATRAGSAARDTQASEASRPAPIVLDALLADPSTHTVAIRGIDPLAPRELLAWRVKSGRYAIAARGASGRNGDLEFPALVTPRDGLEIVVTDVGSAPGLPGASELRRLPGRMPVPPYAQVQRAAGSDFDVRIVPAEATGEIVLADAAGDVFARYPVVHSPLAAQRPLDVTLQMRPEDTYVFVGHQFDDGRRSEFRVILLEPAAGAAAANARD